MTVLLDLVTDVIVRTAVWLAVVVAVAAAIAWALTAAARAARGQEGDLRRATVFAVIGAIAGASLAHRFGWPAPSGLEIWGRPLYPIWLAVGAAVGASASVASIPDRASTAEG